MRTLKLLRILVLLGGLLLSACTGALARQSVPSSTANASGGSSKQVVFTGALQSMNGNQWVINGQTVNVDTASLQDNLNRVGEIVTVAGVMADDGSVNAQSVEASSSNEDDKAAESKSEDASMHDDQESDSDLEAIGLVEGISDTSLTVGGQVYTFAPGAEIKNGITTGTLAKIHFTINTDGSRTITEAEPSDLKLSAHGDQEDDHSTEVNQNSSHDGNSYDDDSDHDSESSSNDEDSGDDHSSDMNHNTSHEGDSYNTNSGSSYYDD